jgi:gliding motility-associated-like protein
VILSHLTNCDPNTPDGALAATVNGNTVNYTIQWYDGSSIQNQIDNDGEFYYNRPAGPYTTTATDVVSACVSDPVVTEILPFTELPELELTTMPTHCEANVGQASFVVLNDVEIKSIEWDIDGQAFNAGGTIATELPKGSFTVIVTTVKECVTSLDFEILPEILVFNGISKNGDGQNDSFEISCIEDFPNNRVKIFNRAGTLVYTARGYNNSDISFNGVSNEGISIMGTELPDGTYFYIIDKGDGSKPRTGYLELLRN